MCSFEQTKELKLRPRELVMEKKIHKTVKIGGRKDSYQYRFLSRIKKSLAKDFGGFGGPNPNG